MPRVVIQEETSLWQSRIGAERKVRRVPPASSENVAAFGIAQSPFPASFVKSLLVDTEFHFRSQRKFVDSEFSNKLCCNPSRDNESQHNLPSVAIPVRRDRIVIAQHQKDDRTAKNVLCFERNFACAPSDASNFSPAAAAVIILRCAGRMRIHTFNVMMVPKIAPHVDVGSAAAQHMRQSQAAAAVMTKPNPANTACDFSPTVTAPQDRR